jgi:hypothetical protein
VAMPLPTRELDSLDAPGMVSPTDAMTASFLVGRDHERRLLSGLVDSLNVGGAAAVILGEPGMGKTSLLEFVAEYARSHDVQVHRLHGIESEAVLPFAAITDLLLPLRKYLAKLPRFNARRSRCPLRCRPAPLVAR